MEMSGGNAEKRRIDESDESVDFQNVTEQREIDWDVRNFLRALAMSSDADSRGDRKGPGIRINFESGKSVSSIQMKDAR
jgi:hypothetical protein